jgi:hypothetical protein
MRKRYPKYLVLFALLILFLPAQCTPRVHVAAGGQFIDPERYFELSIPLNGWQLLSWEKVNLVLWDSQTGATIVVNVNRLKGDLNLIALANHLLISFEGERIISRDTEQIDGREALKTVLEARVEQTAITAEAYVVRGNGVSYDIVFWAPRDVFPRQVEAFHHVLASLHFLQP